MSAVGGNRLTSDERIARVRTHLRLAQGSVMVVDTADVALLLSIVDFPRADWSEAWTELRGYIGAAVADQAPLVAAEVTAYMDELLHRALAPVREAVFGASNGAASGDPS